MLTLYGSAVSNYYNTVLAVLCYKEVPFHEVALGASQTDNFLRKSPMGKIPFVEDGGTFVSESTVILEYLEARFPSPPLNPLDPVARARCWQLIKFVELYIDAPARKLFPGVFWYKSNDSVHVGEVLPVVKRGLRAFDQLVVNDPYLMGAAVTFADFYCYFSLHVAQQVMLKQYGCDILAERPRTQEAFLLLEELPFMAAVIARRDQAMVAYLQQKATEAEAG